MKDTKFFLAIAAMMIITILCNIGVEFAEDSTTKPVEGKVIEVATMEPSE